MDMASLGHGVHCIEDEICQHFLKISAIYHQSWRAFNFSCKFNGVSFFLGQVLPAEAGEVPYFLNKRL